MRILLAAGCSSDRNLGVPGVMHSLAEQFEHRGHEVRLRFQSGTGRFSEALFGLRLASSSDARWAEVVDVHAVDAWPLCLLRRRPVVVARSHGLEQVVHRRLMAARSRGDASVGPVYWTYRGSVRLAFERTAIRRSDATFVLNGSDRRICLDDFGASPDRVVQVPNGFPSGFLREGLEEADGIAFVGSWLPRKGNDLAVRAIASVLARRPDQDVLVAGTGAGAEVVLSDFPEAVRGRVRVVERFHREELPSLLAGRGILLFPSRSEGYPLSLAEAMACGLAPVGSAIPGVVDMVEEGRSGLLSPADDWSGLARAILALQSDPDRLRRLRQGARDRVRSTSWEQVADDQLSIYGDLLGRRGADSK